MVPVCLLRSPSFPQRQAPPPFVPANVTSIQRVGFYQMEEGSDAETFWTVLSDLKFLANMLLSRVVWNVAVFELL